MDSTGSMEGANSILADEIIQEKTFMTSVEAGDRVRITAYGMRVIPQVFESTQIAKSFWHETECIQLGPESYERCHTRKKTGRCELRYREQEEDVLEFIAYKEDGEYPLYFTIGNTLYPLSNVTTNNHWVSGELLIREEMLVSGNDLYLDVLPGERLGEIKLGFLKYGRCDGVKFKRFRVSADTSSRVIESRAQNQFVVSLDFKPGEDE